MNKKEFRHQAVRFFYRCINPVRRAYWFVFRPKTRGAKVVIFWEGQVLLVRISYARQLWTFPGGGVNRSESFREAAIREAREEVGIFLKDAEFFYEYKNTQEYKRDTVQCFAAEITEPDFTIDEQEISEARWFPLDALPNDVRPRVKEALLKYSERYNAA